jgi:hypothetical protein
MCLLVEASVSEKRAATIFRAENGVCFYQPVHAVPKQNIIIIIIIATAMKV